MTDLRTAALRALEALEYFVEDYQSEDGLDSMKHYAKCNMEAITALRAALAQPEDKSQAAFEHWVDTVEATQKPEQPISQPEIKVDKETRWLPMPWKGLTEEEHNYYKALGFVGVKAVEEKLRAKNSTLVCIPAVPPGL
jgi:hypothetical protein